MFQPVLNQKMYTLQQKCFITALAAQTLKFMFSKVAYGSTVYKTGPFTKYPLLCFAYFLILKTVFAAKYTFLFKTLHHNILNGLLK